ncbi:Putative protein of unknown function [Podospora comata]|uniref:Uncharacterized protein n=1 Tax=Podospora comata TaxID=48703 RepID=A0ABY6RZ40_PODCO|nr:Putative protein of unknown function [Podospora comata]
MQLEAARHMGHVGDVGSGGQGSLVPETRILSPNTFSENPDGHHSPIGLNINLQYDDGNTDGTTSSPNPKVHAERLLSGVGTSSDMTHVMDEYSPNHVAGNPPGPFVSSGPPAPRPPGGGNGGGSASPPQVVTMTQTVTVPQAGAGSGSGTGSYAYGGYQSANAGGSGAGSYDFGAGSGSGVGGKGAYGAGAGNGGSDPAAYGPPGGGNGQALTVIETTTICLSSAQQSPAGGYGNGGGGSPPCPAGNGNGNGNGNGACQPSQPALQGPLVETVFILGTPSPMAIAPTSCPAGAGNGNGDDGSQYAAQAAPAPPPPPPPPPPPVYVTITQTVAAPPPPPSPAPVPLAAVSFDPPAYAPPNTVAYFGAKGAGLQQQVADGATTSFYTAITAAPHFQQSGAAGAYGDPPDSASAATANGSNSPADSDGEVAPIPAIPPSIWGAGPAQVTAAKAAQDGPSLVILSAALGFILLQALFLTF